MADVLPGRLLVVDDDASARFARARLLRNAGHTVFEAGSLEQARILLKEVRPEVVLLDVNLPDGNGIDFAQRIKADETLHGVMVLQMSASHVTVADQARGLEAGSDAYLAEPAPPTVMLATTRALLRLSRAERALREAMALEQGARREAEEANRVKDDFLATLSHELRTPLHAIIGWAALLRRQSLTEDARRHAVEVIERNAKAQAALIEDLLDVSRINLGQLRLTWGAIEVAPIVAAAVDSIRPTADARGIEIAADLALDPLFTLRGDPTRLQQVFWNLLSNAVKFTTTGGHVSVRTYGTDDRAFIEIGDTGRGISPEMMSRIFDRFQRGERTPTVAEPGLGLGLAIARELVELHGGTVTAASAGLNLGSTFTVSLPRQTTASMPASAPASAAMPASSSAQAAPASASPLTPPGRASAS